MQLNNLTFYSDSYYIFKELLEIYSITNKDNYGRILLNLKEITSNLLSIVNDGGSFEYLHLLSMYESLIKDFEDSNGY